METSAETPLLESPSINNSASQDFSPAWENDASLANLTKIISKKLQLDNTTKTTKETTKSDKRPDDEYTPHQHIRFNLLHHRGVISDVPTLQLFKELPQPSRLLTPC